MLESFVIFQVQILMLLSQKLLNCKTFNFPQNELGSFELDVSDKSGDRDKYNTEIDSSND